MTIPSLYCIAHRGGCGHGTENTLETIEYSIHLGTDAIEIDVWQVEQELLVIHDRRLGRTLPGTGLIRQQSFDALRETKLPCGATIPTLREVFQQVAGRCAINIEIKGHCAIDQLINQINDAKLCGEVVDEQLLISSFDHHQLYRALQIVPNIKRGVLISALPLNYSRVGEPLKAYAINPDINCINQALTDDAQRRGFKVYCYTVNETEDIQHMLAIGVDGVFCDFPERVISLRNGEAYTAALWPEH
jgi:glycerophosphoryl diester phosphodiesterase